MAPVERGRRMKDYFLVSIMGGKVEKVPAGTTYLALSKTCQTQFKSDILVSKSNHQLTELNSPVFEDGNITFADMSDPEGMRVYQRSVSFLLVKAVMDVVGPKTKVVIENSLNKDLYCEIREPGVITSAELLQKVEDRMKELVQADIPIKKHTFFRDTAIEKLQEMGLTDKAKLFRYRSSSNVNLYELDEFYDYFYGYMAPSTKYLSCFQLLHYQKGFLIRFPDPENPQIIPPLRPLDKITNIFMEQMEWLQIMHVNNVADVNDLIVNGDFGDLIRINEALHEKKIASIADQIASKRNVKLVLIAGPSSSGKTTFAQRLSVQLRVIGIRPHVLSMDDYFINRDDVPVDENGKRDFENINSLDLSLLNHDLKGMIGGEKVLLPTFNFITGQREYKGRFIQLAANDVIIMEGIHGLNQELTSKIAEENKFSIFISAMTQLNLDDHNRISTSDSRLIRRLVRDYHFRGSSAIETIDAWPSVTRGEANNIFPYQENADIVFNSATIYEISVLKQYAEPLLYQVDKSMPEFFTAKRLIKFLDYFLGVPGTEIPNHSIIREFIGGSCFHV